MTLAKTPNDIVVPDAMAEEIAMCCAALSSVACGASLERLLVNIYKQGYIDGAKAAVSDTLQHHRHAFREATA